MYPVQDVVTDTVVVELLPVDIIQPDVVVLPEPVVVRDTLVHVAYLMSHIGVPSRDTINMWLAHVGLPPNNPFCSAAVSKALSVAGVKQPTVRSGLARNFVYQTPKYLIVDAEAVRLGAVIMPIGSIVVFQRGETIFGHNGLLTEAARGNVIKYVSANTSAPGSNGSESAGGGVYEKYVRINLQAYFGIREFVLVVY